ncbi:hypothetical protein ABZY05_45650 [Streptomyces canus]|uniref:hypothetical protein n=1 Tax=Streptomyces canus TaxID=58343 RepID=UPI0033A74284
MSAADHSPSEKTAAVLTAVPLRGCAEHVTQRADLPAILEASRHDTPGLLRFLTWSASYHQAEAVRLEREARTALPALKAAEAAWRTAVQWVTLCPHPVLLLMLADPAPTH